jgi:hypothetical protein
MDINALPFTPANKLISFNRAKNTFISIDLGNRHIPNEIYSISKLYDIGIKVVKLLYDKFTNDIDLVLKSLHNCGQLTFKSIWTELEDMILLNNNKSDLYDYLLEIKGEEEITKRKQFLLNYKYSSV